MRIQRFARAFFLVSVIAVFVLPAVLAQINIDQFLVLPFSYHSEMRVQQGWHGGSGGGGIDYIHGQIDQSTTWKPYDVVAAADGEACGNCNASYIGNAVWIKHQYNGKIYYTYYGHLSEIAPGIPRYDAGQTGTKSVLKGEKVGVAGDTGSAGLIHLHFMLKDSMNIAKDAYGLENSNRSCYFPGGSLYGSCVSQYQPFWTSTPPSYPYLQGSNVIFEHANYYGKWHEYFTEFNIVDLPTWFNDKASSMRVQPGWLATLYQHSVTDPNWPGGKKYLLGDDSDFAGDHFDNGVALNDAVSSLSVQRLYCPAGQSPVLGTNIDLVGTCEVPTPTPQPPPSASGWTQTFFSDNNLSSPCGLPRNETDIYMFRDSDSGWNTPVGCPSVESVWSVRMERNDAYFAGGTYEFGLFYDDAARLYVDGQLVVDGWNATQHYESRSISQGNHQLRLEYKNNAGHAIVQMWWRGPGALPYGEAQDPNQWWARYWGNQTQWQDAIGHQNEGTGFLNKNWGYGGPGFGIPSDHFSTRFERTLYFDCGTYRFHLTSDDGSRLLIDGVLVPQFDHWSTNTWNTTADLSIVEGSHTLMVDHFENGGEANLYLDWIKVSSCVPAPPNSPTLVSPISGFTFSEGTAVTLDWSGNSSDIYYSYLWGGPISIDDPALCGGWQGASDCPIGTLWAGNTYFWRVEARNAGGSAWSDTWTFSVKLGTPSNLNAQAVTCDTVNLTWQDNSNNESGYRVFRNGSPIAEVGANVASFQDTTASPQMNYTYTVKAFKDSVESDPSNTAITTTSACGPRTLYVPQDYLTIGQAIEAAQSGDTILVSQGIYNEKITIKSGVKVIGSGATATTIRGDGVGVVVYLDGSAQLSGFTITNSGTENWDSGIWVSNTSMFGLISKNIITGNNKGIVVYCFSPCSTGPDIVNNMIYGNGSVGLFVHDGAMSISNNTIANNSAGIVVDKGTVILNNTVTGNTAEGINGNNKSHYLDYNNVWNNGQNYVGATAGTNDISIDPLYVSPSTNDFHVSPQSSLIDQGVFLEAVWGEDFDSQPRPFDGDGDDVSIFDIGADEYVGPPAPPPPADLIFKDSFESGNLSAWSSSVTDSGDLSVNAAAALVGSFGLKAVIDSNGAIYVQDNTPASESSYHARFYFDPNSIPMAAGNAHYIFVGRNGTVEIFRVEFRRNNGKYEVRAQAANDGTGYLNTPWSVISDASHYIEIDWKASSAAGAKNGYIKLLIDNVLKGTKSGIDNDTRRVDDARLGPSGSIDTGTRGTYYFDAFESRKLTSIGP